MPQFCTKAGRGERISIRRPGTPYFLRTFMAFGFLIKDPENAEAFRAEANRMILTARREIIKPTNLYYGKLPIILCLALVAALRAFAAGEDAFYKLGPDSLPQDGVPKGKLIGRCIYPARSFPITRTYLIYVPAQYDPKEPAGLMIFQDGSAMIRGTATCACRTCSIT